MTQVWCMWSPKGGAGKTTTAALLAGEITRLGGTVALIDADPNKPLVRWAAKGNLPATAKVLEDDDEDGYTIIDNINAAAEANDFVIVDTEGTNNSRATVAASRSHMILIPLQGSELDLAEALKAQRFVNHVSKTYGRTIPAVVIRTRVSGAIKSRTDTIIQDAAEDAGLPMCRVPILDKDAYRAVFVYGRVLHELEAEGSVGGLKKAQENVAAVLAALAEMYNEAVAA